MRLYLLAFLVILSACKETSVDADAGLYDPVPPKDSAFVRFINMGEDSLKPKIGNKDYDDLKVEGVSPYYVVKKGGHKITMAPHVHKTTFNEGEFYTLTNNSDKNSNDTNIVILSDTANTDRSKATIALYNLSRLDSVTLKAKSGSVNVLRDVAKNSTKARDMNAVKIDFGIYQGDNLLAEIDEEVLERGNHYSVIYNGSNAKIITATTNTRK